MLGTAESKVARALIGGHAASIAKAVLHMDDIRESIIVQLLRKLNEEYNDLCKSIFPTSPNSDTQCGYDGQFQMEYHD